jgi:hypothetical protein
MPVSDVPEGHPIPWDQLVAYERDQGGYWLYPDGRDVCGNGKVWVAVPRPEEPGELQRYVRQVQHLAQRISSRAEATGNTAMAELAGRLTRACTGQGSS